MRGKRKGERGMGKGQGVRGREGVWERVKWKEKVNRKGKGKG